MYYSKMKKDSNKLALTEIKLDVDDISRDISNDEIKIIKKRPDNDAKQMAKVTISFGIEIFKIIMSSALLISVIQDCDGKVCSYEENISRTDIFTYSTIGINLLNILIFIGMYTCELKREFFLIKYFDIDKTKGDYHLPKVLNNYSNIRTMFIGHNSKYLISVSLLVIISIINWIISSVYISYYYYGFKTITSLATNILLVTTKLYDSYSIAKESNKKCYGLSAYMTEYVSFNVIDQDFIK